MATARQTIKRAYRLLRVHEKSEEPDADDAANGLSLLNSLIKRGSWHYPFRDWVVTSSFTADREMPALRLLVTAGGSTVTLPKCPYDGARIDVVLIGAVTVTLNPNGLLLNGSTSSAVVITATRYHFRGDLGDWVPISTLAIDTSLPYPDDYDEELALILADGLIAEQGMAADPAVIAFVAGRVSDARATLAARYKKAPNPIHELAVRNMPSSWTRTIGDSEPIP